MLSYVLWSCHGLVPYYLQTVYDIVNPILCICGIVLVMRVGVGCWNAKNNVRLFVFVSLCLVGSRQGWFWFIGNMNWLYPCIAAMLFFVMWEGVFRGNFKVRAWKFLLSMPLAVVIGMSNENTSLVSLLLFVGCGGYACIRQRRICVTWQYAVIAVLLLAAAAVFYTAPCRAARVATAGWELSFHNILFNSLLNPINWAYTAIFYWREAVVLGIMLFIARKRGVRLMDRRMAVLLAVLVLLWGVLLAAPSWGAPRSFTPLDLMLYALMARMLCKIINHENVGTRDCGTILAVRSVLTLTVLVPLLVLAGAQYGVRCQIEEHADAALARGETRLVLHTGDLDTSPVMPRFFKIPGCVIAHDLKPHVPLIGISKARYESGADYSHRVVFPYQGKGFASCGDDVLNSGVAKRFGLESILYVVELLMP